MNVQKAIDLYENVVRPVAARVPVLGGLFKDGVTTSEGAPVPVLVGLISFEALKASPNPWVIGAEALGLVGVGLYALSRSRFKAAVMEMEAAEKAAPDPIGGFLGGNN